MMNDFRTRTPKPDATTVERPRYFPRQVITADDLTLEQEYLRDKARRHNRLLHGWGVVCGATLTPTPNALAWKVIIKTGYILGPFGDEIYIEKDRCFDIRTRCVVDAVTSDPCDDPCGSAAGYQPPLDGGTVHVAVRYVETKTRPVRVQASSCGCDESPCEFSRLRDGYEICVLDDCHLYDDGPSGESLRFGGNFPPDFPPLPTDPWVPLAAVSFDAQGNITQIDHCSCRRQVVSLADKWWRCYQNEFRAQAEVKASPGK